MRKQIILTILVLLSTGLALAQTPDTTNSGIAPTSPFYFLDRFSESLELAVAKSPLGSEELESKVRANHAAERLSEAQTMAAKNNTEKVEKLMNDYSKQMNKSTESANKANNSRLSRKLTNVTSSQIDTLEKIEKELPENAKKGINKAIDNNINSQKRLAKKPETERGDRNKPGANNRTNNSGDIPRQNETKKTENKEEPQKSARSKPENNNTNNKDIETGKEQSNNREPENNNSQTDSTGEKGNNQSLNP